MLDKRTFLLLLLTLTGLLSVILLAVWGSVSLARKGVYVPGELWVVVGVALGAAGAVAVMLGGRSV